MHLNEPIIAFNNNVDVSIKEIDIRSKHGTITGPLNLSGFLNIQYIIL